MVGKLETLRSWIFLGKNFPVTIVLIHDYNDEGTSKEIKNILNQISDTHIIFIEQFFGGPGAARNAGLEEVCSEWVCFWDSDDLPNLEMAFKMIAASEDFQEVLIGNFVILNSDGRTSPEGINHDSDIRKIANNPGLWRMIFRNSSLGNLRFDPGMMGEDQVFIAEYELSTKRIGYFNEVTYSYLKNVSGQLTSNPKAIHELTKSFVRLLKLYEIGSDESRRFTSRLIARTFITLMKKGPRFSRILIIARLLGTCLNNPKLFILMVMNLSSITISKGR
jgi:glycosyltransferase involved in cell wall biosynthesis